MRTSQKKWERLSAVILTFALLLSMLPATAMAASTGDKSIDNEVHYQVNGAIDAGVRYWSIEYDKVDTDGSILLNGSKFADRSNQWGLSNTEPYAGRFLLNFHRVEFYEQIQGVSIVSGNNVTEFDKEANGALWTVPINTRTWASGKIGVVTNSQIRITLKNGQTLESLQLENTPISFETFAVTGSGNPGGSSMMVNRSWDQGFILANNQNRKDEQKTGFLTGPMSNRISLDYNQLTGQLVIKSIHSFKPNVKIALRTCIGWFTSRNRYPRSCCLILIRRIFGLGLRMRMAGATSRDRSSEQIRQSPLILTPMDWLIRAVSVRSALHRVTPVMH